MDVYVLRFPSTETRIPVTGGWNMIAPYHNALATSGVSTVNSVSNRIATSFFHYSSGYGVATALNLGGGYWVKVDADGFLHRLARHRFGLLMLMGLGWLRIGRKRSQPS